MKKIFILTSLILFLFIFSACKVEKAENVLEVQKIESVELFETFELDINSTTSYTITALDDVFSVEGTKIKALKEGTGKLKVDNGEKELEIEIEVTYTFPSDELESDAIYLGIYNFGTVTKASIDNFKYRFFINDEEKTYTMEKIGDYELQNQLEEGKIYHLTIDNNKITNLKKLDNLVAFSNPKQSSVIEGKVEEITKYNIKINDINYQLLNSTKQYKILKAAGGANVLEDEIKVNDNVVITLSSKGYCQNIYKEKETPTFTPVINPTPGERTLTNFFKTALSAVGHALYVYGGNWDFQDVGSSNQARSIGVADSWVEFFYEQDASYNYKNTVAKNSYYPFGEFNEYYYAGVDCSGFVGWVMYNVLNTENGHEGYVMGSNKMAKTFAQTYNLGTYTKDYSANVDGAKTFKVGDIISCTGHIWICLGVCSDGSLVIIHSTPSTSYNGVSGGGAQLGAIGNSESCEAYKLADAYNKKYYPDWASRYPTSLKSYSTYLAQGNQNNGKFSWSLDEKGVLDPDNLSTMLPDQILKVLFNENE